MQVFKIKFAINCPWIRNGAIFFAIVFWGQIYPGVIPIFIHIHVGQGCVTCVEFLCFFLALKTVFLMLRVEHSTKTRRSFPVAAWPTLCDIAISCGWSGGSTFLISSGYHASHAALTGEVWHIVPWLFSLKLWFHCLWFQAHPLKALIVFVFHLR